MKANQKVRDSIYFNKLKHWEVANEIGVSNSHFSVLLRTPLNDEWKEKINKAIESLTSTRELD